MVRYHLRFFVRVGHETTYAAIIGNHNFFNIPSSDLPKLLKTSVKPVHTGFTEVLNNIGRSDDDMF